MVAAKRTWCWLAVSLSMLSWPARAQAGCGCEKPSPALATVRPQAVYAGAPMSLFSPRLQSGQAYTVVFTSGVATQSRTVQTQAVTKRDLADGRYKPQLIIPAPDLPLGPASISVSQAGQQTTLFTVSDALFTLVPQPVIIPAQAGEFAFENFQAAVSRGGITYLSLDVSQVTFPLAFQAQLKSYPLRFSNKEVVFYNRQGFLMQQWDKKLPGLFSIAMATGGGDSDLLLYSRHEFNTYFLQHSERQPHALDPTDPNWHSNGTPHIDHNYLIVAVAGSLNGGPAPAPGATPPAPLVLQTASLFDRGFVGIDSVEMAGQSSADSYRSTTGQWGQQGDLWSNGRVKLSDDATVHGNIQAKSVDRTGRSWIWGRVTEAANAVKFPPVLMPQLLSQLQLNGPKAPLTLTGPASYRVDRLMVGQDRQLIVNNADGPVTLYVTGEVKVFDRAAIMLADPNPEKFAIYVEGKGKVQLSGAGVFFGVIYAPESEIMVNDQGELFGAIVGKKIKIDRDAVLHYDSSLRGE